MAKYPQETTEEHKAQVFRVIALRPHISGTQLQKVLEENGLKLDYEYVLKMLKEVRDERSRKINNDTREMLYAEFEELANYIIEQLRAIATQEKIVYEDSESGIKKQILSQKNRINAFNSILEAAEKKLNMRMDLGLLERKLGEMNVNQNMMDIMMAVKMKRDEERGTKQRNNDNGQVHSIE